MTTGRGVVCRHYIGPCHSEPQAKNPWHPGGCFAPFRMTVPGLLRARVLRRYPPPVALGILHLLPLDPAGRGIWPDHPEADAIRPGAQPVVEVGCRSQIRPLTPRVGDNQVLDLRGSDRGGPRRRSEHVTPHIDDGEHRHRHGDGGHGDRWPRSVGTARESASPAPRGVPTRGNTRGGGGHLSFILCAHRLQPVGTTATLQTDQLLVRATPTVPRDLAVERAIEQESVGWLKGTRSGRGCHRGLSFSHQRLQPRALLISEASCTSFSVNPPWSWVVSANRTLRYRMSISG